MNNQEKLMNQYYSTHYSRIMPKTIEEWQWVIERIELNFGKFFDAIPRDSLILDIACGVGYLEYYLLKKGFTKIHAIDLSEEQIKIAKNKLQEFRCDFSNKVKFYAIDAFEYLKTNLLPPPPSGIIKNSYTVIAMIDLLDHLEKDKVIEILDLSKHALQDKGFICIRVSNACTPMFPSFFYSDFTHKTPFTLSSIQQCFSLTGFKVINMNYEKIPKRRNKIGSIGQLNRFIRLIGLKLLGSFLGMPSAAFSRDLIAIGKK
ncbi:MAG: class I SAM-dependent methyltransferase [Patescibacteria group bacterium]